MEGDHAESGLKSEKKNQSAKLPIKNSTIFGVV